MRECLICGKLGASGKRFYCSECTGRDRDTKSSGRRNYENRVAVVRRIKSRPCMDCKRPYPSVCMEFDHRDGKSSKVDNVSRLIINNGIRAVLAEIAKCDVVCANCHALRTHHRRRGRQISTPRQTNPITEG